MLPETDREWFERFEKVMFTAGHSALTSPNESDSNGEVANVVDGLFFIGRALLRIASALEKKSETT